MIRQFSLGITAIFNVGIMPKLSGLGRLSRIVPKGSGSEGGIEANADLEDLGHAEEANSIDEQVVLPPVGIRDEERVRPQAQVCGVSDHEEGVTILVSPGMRKLGPRRVADGEEHLVTIECDGLLPRRERPRYDDLVLDPPAFGASLSAGECLGVRESVFESNDALGGGNEHSTVDGGEIDLICGVRNLR